MKAFLDTCVLTELGKADGNPLVKSVVAEIATADLYLSVLTVGEIAKGIALLNAGRKKTSLGTWLARVENQYADRILSIDVQTARIWGELTARARKSGVSIPGTDGLRRHRPPSWTSRHHPQHPALSSKRGSRSRPLARHMTVPYLEKTEQ